MTETDLLVKSQQLLKTWTEKDIKEFLPELIIWYEKLDFDTAVIEQQYDLYKIERYEHYKKMKWEWKIKWTEKEIEIESKKDALKKYWDQLLWKKIAQHYKLNIDQLSQRKIDIATENKNLRQSWL